MFLVGLILVLLRIQTVISVENISTNALQFPPSFKFGVSTAAYQIEGGWNASGKGESIWDRLTHKNPDMIKDRSDGDIACDSFHLYTEDVMMLKNISVDFYRFSLSWTRLLPNGYANSFNLDGERYYSDLIDLLLANNIQPWVTLYHWDLPQKLQEIGGWANPLMAVYFRDYANYAFKTFGDRVKTWITFNEPLEICSSGYGEGGDAPAYKQSGIADYLCGKTLLMAHAKAYHLYNYVYRKKQNGLIGITINTEWSQPISSKFEDIEAAERSLQMNFGWFAHPIFHKRGDYPDIMKQRILNISCTEKFQSSRLPPLSDQELRTIRGTFDFMGLNHYTTRLVTNYQYPNNYPTSRKKDVGVKMTTDAAWKSSPVLSWLKVVPWGLRRLLIWIKKEYGNPPVYITENGYADTGEIEDKDRIKYLKNYMKSILQAIYIDECNVNAYAVWSLMDNMEWREGYIPKFGLYSVNFKSSERTRTARKSAGFYQNVISTRQLTAVVCVPVMDEDATTITTFEEPEETTPYCPTLPSTEKRTKATTVIITEDVGEDPDLPTSPMNSETSSIITNSSTGAKSGPISLDHHASSEENERVVSTSELGKDTQLPTAEQV